MQTTLLKILSALGIGILSTLWEVRWLCGLVAIAIAIDFWTGYRLSQRRKERFKSQKAWNTLRKLVYALAAVLFAYLVQVKIITMVDLYLGNIFAGAIIGVEMYSFLGNMAALTDYKVFGFLAKVIENKGEKLKDQVLCDNPSKAE